MPVIRAFNNQKVEEKKFEEANGRILKNLLFVGRSMGLVDAADHAGDELYVDPDRLGRCTPDRCRCDAGRQYDGLHAVCHA